MCSGSLLIAITPSYATAGMAAPTMLVLARLLQGLSVGGEYGASATYLSEMAGQRRRGFYSSFQYVTLIMGQLLALAVLLLLQRWLSESDLEAWGWRIPFVVGAAFALIVFRTRRRMEETTAFHAVTVEREPLRQLVLHSPRAARSPSTPSPPTHKSSSSTRQAGASPTQRSPRPARSSCSCWCSPWWAYCPMWWGGVPC